MYQGDSLGVQSLVLHSADLCLILSITFLSAPTGVNPEQSARSKLLALLDNIVLNKQTKTNNNQKEKKKKQRKHNREEAGFLALEAS